MSDKPILSERAKSALNACFATKGKRKGRLLAKAPSPMQSDAYAAWQGAMLSCNPFKVSICGLMFVSAEQKALADEVTAYIDARPALRKECDWDRYKLEQLGVW